MKGRMSPSWEGEGFALKISIAHYGIRPFTGKDAIFSEQRRRSCYGSPAVILLPGPTAQACPILSLCSRSQAHLCPTSASSLWPPLQHTFTTSFNVLLPPQGSCTGPCVHSLPRDQHQAVNAPWLQRCLFQVYREIQYTHVCMYIGVAWADEWLQEEGAHSDKAASSSAGPLAMVMLPLAPQPRALARCWDSALFPEIAFKVVFKKTP